MAGIQLIFFTVASVASCFGFRMGIMLTTQRCFSCCRAVLHRIDYVSASGAAPSEGALKVHKELGRDRTWTADPDWPKGYSTTYGVMLNNKTRGTGQGVGCCCSGTSSVIHQSAGSEQLLLLILFCFPSFSLSLSLPIGSCTLQSSPHLTMCRGVNEWSLVFSSPCWVKPQQSPHDNPWYFLSTGNFYAFNRSKLHHTYTHRIISYSETF